MPSDLSNVSVVIPVKNAAAFLPDLLPRILSQKPAPPREILLLDSASTDRTREIAAEFEAVRVIGVERFSHGGTRNQGIREAKGDFVVLMTQDARPEGEHWLQALLAPFDDPKVAYVFSRQVPYPDASPMEGYFLSVRFPPGEPVRYETGGEPVTCMEQTFSSNVSSAVRREAVLEHPFDDSLIMSEDQQLSRDLQEAGYAVVYAPASVVTHSHTYTLMQTFRRYFDSVVSGKKVWPHHRVRDSARVGRNLFIHEFRFIVFSHPIWVPYFLLQQAVKVLAALVAHAEPKLPRGVVRFCSMHRYHWR